MGGMHSVCVYEGALWGVCIVYVCMRGRCGGMHSMRGFIMYVCMGGYHMDVEGKKEVVNEVVVRCIHIHVHTLYMLER